MPHFKCVPCKTRLYRPGPLADGVGDLCPGCGFLLEPAGELSELVGFRAIRSSDADADTGARGTHERIAGRVDELFAHRTAVLARAREPDAVAEAVALPRPEESQ